MSGVRTYRSGARVIIVDPFKKKVYETSMSTKLEELQKVVGGYIQVVPLTRFVPNFARHELIVDEEGLMKRDQRVWRLEGWPDTLVGIGVIIGTSGENHTAAGIALSTVQRMVTFER